MWGNPAPCAPDVVDETQEERCLLMLRDSSAGQAVNPSAPLVVSIRYRLGPEIQPDVARDYPGVVFRELGVKNGLLEVVASVPAGIHQRFLSHVLAFGGSVVQGDPSVP
jgi:hypothetical protein